MNDDDIFPLDGFQNLELHIYRHNTFTVFINEKARTLSRSKTFSKLFARFKNCSLSRVSRPSEAGRARCVKSEDIVVAIAI